MGTKICRASTEDDRAIRDLDIHKGSFNFLHVNFWNSI